MNKNVKSLFLLRGATAPATSQIAMSPEGPSRTFQVVGKTTAGAGAAEVDILGSNSDDVNEAVLLGTISLTLGTVPKGEGFASTAPWRLLWARVNSISGTGASVSALVGA